ncbi:MAG: glycosyltransferase family 4 protein [Verrucomicrobiota bacterium JB022]|nr:glycosyltransferase family 4 protein [Verrucomicrobiota bacterium JB022]
MRRRILIYSPQLDALGGIERHLVEACRLLRAHDWEVTLLSTSNSLHPAVQQSLEEAGVRLRMQPVARGHASARQKLTWLLREVVALRRERWDVVYTNAQGGLAPFVWMAAQPETRVIHHHHTSADASEQAGWNLPFRLTLQHAPILVSCSHATRLNIRAATGRDSLDHLPCLYPWEPGDTVYTPPLGPPWRLLFAGRLAASKGIDTILHLAQQPELADVEWHLYGSGDYGAADFEGLPRVHYHGRYESRAELLQSFSQAHGMVLFSRHSEGLPITLLEATELGLPWIATDRGGTRELALRTPDCQVLPADFTDADALEAVLRLRTALQHGQTSPAALRTAFAQGYDPADVRTRWMRLFEEG